MLKYPAFMPTDPNSPKRQLCNQYLFTLLEPTLVKAAGKMLVKLTFAVNFINVLRMRFLKVHSKPDSKQRKGVKKTFVQKTHG